MLCLNKFQDMIFCLNHFFSTEGGNSRKNSKLRSECRCEDEYAVWFSNKPRWNACLLTYCFQWGAFNKLQQHLNSVPFVIPPFFIVVTSSRGWVSNFFHSPCSWVTLNSYVQVLRSPFHSTLSSSKALHPTEWNSSHPLVTSSFLQ